jgi:5-methylcytosine-specific restriction endonuclease McrA
VNDNTGILEKKVCSKCLVEKIATTEFFNVNKKCRYGLNSVCKTCGKKWRQENKDKLTEYNRERRKNNPEKLEEWKKKYAATHRENQRLYKMNNKEKVREYNRIYNKSYRQTLTAKFNKKKYKQKRKYKDKILINTLTKQDWEDALEYFKRSCAYCGLRTHELHQEHVIPSAKDGHYTRQNIIPACSKCNLSKGAKDLLDWYPNHISFEETRFGRIAKWTNIKENNSQQIALF